MAWTGDKDLSALFNSRSHILVLDQAETGQFILDGDHLYWFSSKTFLIISMNLSSCLTYTTDHLMDFVCFCNVSLKAAFI